LKVKNTYELQIVPNTETIVLMCRQETAHSLPPR